MTHENPATSSARVLDRSGPDVRLARGRGVDRRDATGAVGGTFPDDNADSYRAHRTGANARTYDSTVLLAVPGRGPDDPHAGANARPAYAYHAKSDSETQADFDTDPLADAISKPNADIFDTAYTLSAAGAVPDAGSDSPANRPAAPAHSPVLRERRGQRRRDRDAVRDRDYAGRGDGPGMPWSGRGPAGGLYDDHLQRAGHVDYGLRWDGERGWRDFALLRGGRGLWLGSGDAVRRVGSGRDAGRDDVYLVGIERGGGESLQREWQRRRGFDRVLGAGVMA